MSYVYQLCVIFFVLLIIVCLFKHVSVVQQLCVLQNTFYQEDGKKNDEDDDANDVGDDVGRVNLRKWFILHTQFSSMHGMFAAIGE